MITRKHLRFCSIVLVVATLLSLSACAAPGNAKGIEDCYQVRTNSDLTHSYQITDLKGNVLLSENAANRAPDIRALSATVLEVSTQTGTGLSTNWAIYCDVKTGVVSEPYYYVLGAKDGYVFYVEYIENKHNIICQSIFDAKSYTQIYSVEDPLIILDSFSPADLETDGVATISYLTGDTAITQEYITIYFPNERQEDP